MKEKPRLGRGLDALFGESDGTAATMTAIEQQVVPIERIEQNPFQPRRVFDAEELAGLSESIKNHGLLQPLVVRLNGEKFQLVAGERRLRAALSVGFREVPVRVVDFNDQQVLEAALVENIQRADLNPIEKALGFRDYLQRFNMTQEELAAKLGLDRTTISNLIGLLDLAPEVQDSVRLKQITLGHAKVLKGIKDKDRQLSVCKEIIGRGLSVHATEVLVKQPKPEETVESQPAAPKPAAVEKTTHVVGIEDELRQKLMTRVEIRLRGSDRGQLILNFETNDDFQRILEVLRK